MFLVSNETRIRPSKCLRLAQCRGFVHHEDMFSTLFRLFRGGTGVSLMASDLEPDIRNEASNETRKQYLSADKAHKALGWSPLFTLQQGLERTIAWYKAFRAAET